MPLDIWPKRVFINGGGAVVPSTLSAFTPIPFDFAQINEDTYGGFDQSQSSLITSPVGATHAWVQAHVDWAPQNAMGTTAGVICHHLFRGLKGTTPTATVQDGYYHVFAACPAGNATGIQTAVTFGTPKIPIVFPPQESWQFLVRQNTGASLIATSAWFAIEFYREPSSIVPSPTGNQCYGTGLTTDGQENILPNQTVYFRRVSTTQDGILSVSKLFSAISDDTGIVSAKFANNSKYVQGYTTSPTIPFSVGTSNFTLPSFVG